MMSDRRQTTPDTRHDSDETCPIRTLVFVSVALWIVVDCSIDWFRPCHPTNKKGTLATCDPPAHRSIPSRLHTHAPRLLAP